MTELSKQIARDLMIRIVSGEYAGDQSFPKESELCAQYDVSRVVVREAKKRLQALGMLKTKKKAGSTVMPKMRWNFFDRDLFSLYLRYSDDFEQQMESYYTLRRLLEPEITAYVAEHAPQEVHDFLKEQIAIIIESHRRQDADSLNEADLAFHLKIYEASNNILVYPLANLMVPMFLKSFAVTMIEWNRGLVEHTDTYEAIASRSGERARACALRVVDAGYSRFRRQWKTHQESGETAFMVE